MNCIGARPMKCANLMAKLAEDPMVEVELIVDKLEDYDDVQAVFTNLA